MNLRVNDCSDERRDRRQFYVGVFRTAHHHRLVFYAQPGARSSQWVRPITRFLRLAKRPAPAT